MTSAQRDFFNTINLSGTALAQAVSAAKGQDDNVLAIFSERDVPLTPWQVWQAGCDRGMKWLITSVRRSIHNLTDSGALVKTDVLAPGPHGKPSYQWRQNIDGTRGNA